MARVGDLILIKTNFDTQLRNLEDKFKTDAQKLSDLYNPQWQATQSKMQEAVSRVKKANDWGDDVIFYTDTRQWIRLTPEEVTKMKNAESKPTTNATVTPPALINSTKVKK